ncbi:AMP-dependent synthetase and ligase [Methyloglobulus morosus KoM1]|uniref:AMP-dependent synthetase and ligase n=1 Tax=Methyloglobulus morosus KoM1 TaxID=1116472 RepID=V5E150_9GAMM|nr:AMP-binding protein [Methyloglobulus morosus]ESS73281.1 AMP-dependent synthetase and ligase [Methyloglobulus morosus KoM1]
MNIESGRMPLSQCALGRAPSVAIAQHQGQRIGRVDFSRDVANKAAVLIRQPEMDYALYCDQAYPFAVMLFALWHAGKSVWVAANNRPATAEKLLQQGCVLLGDWPMGKAMLLPSLSSTEGTMTLSELDLRRSCLTLFTSGSTGIPQAIPKELWQLQCEVDGLEQQWGTELAGSQALATVSHQHIYGLLFRVLWPLATGRCFHSQIYLSPESLLKSAQGQSSYWVASPAQLKRLDEELTPWSELSRLKAIFSSGGTIDLAVARFVERHCSQRLIDIYGSSETGGIAWRKPVADERWLPFPGVNIAPTAEQQYLLTSPYLPSGTPYLLNDRLEMDEDGRFRLLGRSDRIVKIEEKRLSLDEMEQVLQQSDWVQQAYCQSWNDKRVRIASVIVLTAQGLDYLMQEGRGSLIKQLRYQLLDSFETVVLPKKWLFIDQLPLSAQGKIDHEKINGLLSLDSRLFPQLQFFSQKDSCVELSLRVQADLPYFSGHFPGQPILPGVAQLAWVEKYGKLFFPITRPFSSMEVIKFKKIIRPDDKLTLQLRWNESGGKLYFDFSSPIESHSSGRLLYGVEK